MKEWYGYLMGPVYMVPFALSGLFAGKLAESDNRKTYLAVAIIAASLTLGVSAFDNPFWIFAFMRVLQGGISSVMDPLAFSMVKDMFPMEKRIIANSLIASSGKLAEGIASLSILLISFMGW